MKFNKVQESKQLNSSVERDFMLLKTAITELEAMLGDEEVSGEEIEKHCLEIEGFASAISAGVQDNFEGIEWDEEETDEDF